MTTQEYTTNEIVAATTAIGFRHDSTGALPLAICHYSCRHGCRGAKQCRHNARRERIQTYARCRPEAKPRPRSYPTALSNGGHKSAPKPRAVPSPGQYPALRQNPIPQLNPTLQQHPVLGRQWVPRLSSLRQNCTLVPARLQDRMLQWRTACEESPIKPVPPYYLGMWPTNQWTHLVCQLACCVVVDHAAIGQEAPPTSFR